MASVDRVNTSPGGALLITNDRDAGHGDDTAILATLKNVTNTATVTLGPTAGESASADAWPWEPSDGVLSLELEPGESWYGAAATEQVIAILVERRP